MTKARKHIYKTKDCENCGEPFTRIMTKKSYRKLDEEGKLRWQHYYDETHGAKFCSVRCRVAEHRRRKHE
jgi:hypothetical protein